MKTGKSRNITIASWVGGMVFVLLSLMVSFSVLPSAYAGGGKNVTGAKIYIQQGRLDDAIRVLKKEAYDENPQNEDAWYLLGYIYARQAKYDSMITCFDKAVEIEPKLKEKGVKVSKDTGTKFHAEFGADMIEKMIWTDLFNGGVKYFNDAVNAPDEAAKEEFFRKAADSFNMSTMVAPDSLMGYRNAAAAYMNVGDYEKSVEPLENGLKQDPNDTELKVLLAQVHMINGDMDKGLPILEGLWSEGVRTEEVAEYLSRGYLNSDQKDKAKQVYKEALESNPENYTFRYNYGTLLLQANEYDNAIAQFEEAHRLDSTSAELNYNLGAAYLNRGVSKHDSLPEESEDESYKEDFKLAQPYLERSIELNPDDELTWTALGQIAGQLNKIALAGYAFSKAEPTRQAFDGKVIVNMESAQLEMIFGTPDQKKHVESESFSVEEWAYTKGKKQGGQVAVPQAINVYVKAGKVDALMVHNN